MNWTEEDQPHTYQNPCSVSFNEWKKEMVEVSEGVFKKVVKQPVPDAKVIDLTRTRVTYHRNMYQELQEYPFDSTYLNGKTDELCLATNNGSYLLGFLKAIESMKEGEKSMFIVSYKMMFKELGCIPRVGFYSSLLSD